MQLVVVYHVLDLATYPQSVIAELARIVRKGGELIIFGFNPFSLWGVIRSICWFHHQPPWCCHFIRPGRLMDWLSVLHFENWQVDSQFMSQRGRETQTNLKARLRSLYQDQRLVQVTSRLQASLRSTYCLHITKRISPLTPIKNKIGLPRLIGLANQSSIVTDLSSARSPQGDINS